MGINKRCHTVELVEAAADDNSWSITEALEASTVVPVVEAVTEAVAGVEASSP